MIEKEEQRKGRNKATQINKSYIESGEYRRKFDLISDNVELARILFALAKEMLFHRAGTNFEDMYWIDLDSYEVFAKETECCEEKKIAYSESTQKALRKRRNVLAIHSHPDGFPPSIFDINSCILNDYTVGIVVGHNGTVFMYSTEGLSEPFNVDYYQMVVAGYIKQGYNEDEAQRAALQELCEKHGIKVKEVL